MKGYSDSLLRLLYVLLPPALVVGACALLACFWFDTWDQAVLYVSGERLLVSPRELECGEIRSGTSNEFSLSLINWTGEDVRFVGSRMSCSCAEVSDFPFTLATGERRVLRVHVKAVARQPRTLDETMFLYTDSRFKKILPVRLHASVIPFESGEGEGSTSASRE
jgi:hypothetical protein